MKVLDLSCAHGHVFEGWFASEEDYRQQRERGLIECPVCGDRAIDKRLSAPYVQTRRVAEQPNAAASVADPQAAQLAEQLRRLRAWVRSAEDVGERFAAEARAMHEGHAPARRIRGRASLAEAVELWEEGIAALPLPDSPLLDDQALH
ncbi:hypothetical protein Talka_00144 [Tepidimonas alkaliphilus]|uniref:Uncharacterized protein n=1 Tax=Tepidimonas alkaliphilus TaxID=2588942 RepID=A0A554WD20_9BURK|nr:DUF1178 family protein [Tepidimonas alkaliphilus]TSE21469.1 hypothetical protein Talka_00144 [Tepidimonas alkaliphilus]